MERSATTPTTYAFDFFQKVDLYLALYTEDLAKFCHDLIQNHLSQLFMHKKLYSSHLFKNKTKQILSLFPIV